MFWEILLIIACVGIVASVVITSIINKKKGNTSGGCDCSCCRYSSNCKTNKEKK